MDVNSRIKNIGKYFGVFNVHEGTVCVGVTFPDKWTLFDVETICNEFHVQIQVKDGTTFFLCDINDGFDPVFDAVDFIIEQNRALEEKTALLKEKVEELRVLFETESLDKLQTLHFVFDEDTLVPVKEVPLPIDIKKEIKKNNKKGDPQVSDTEKEIVEETEPTVKPQKRVKKKNNPGDSSLMNFVKDALENE
jgi:hypothetical protein